LFELKIPQDIKKRIDKLYEVLKEAQDEGEDTTEIEKRILKLEKRYIEHALRVKLTPQELRELKSIVNVKTVFPGSKVVAVGKKPRFESIMTVEQYKTHLLNKSPNDREGGEPDMGFTIGIQLPMPAGEGEAAISSVNTVDGKWGPRLQIVFEDNEERTAIGFYPTKATESNMLGKLLKAVYGKIQKVESDDLLGQRLKVLVEHLEKDDKTYSNVIDFP